MQPNPLPRRSARACEALTRDGAGWECSRPARWVVHHGGDEWALCGQHKNAALRNWQGATATLLNIPLDKDGYGHYAIRCPLLGAEPIDVEHDDLEGL